MTITIIGPDQSKFNFPDDTPQDTISSAMSQHYAGTQAPAPDQGDGSNYSAISAAEDLPGIGAYAAPAAAWLRTKAKGGTQAQNLAQIRAGIDAHRPAHPIRSKVEGAAIGSLPYMFAGEFAGPARLLGMTGDVVPASIMGGASNAAIGAVDAYLRGEDPKEGALRGLGGGVGGVLIGKAAGHIWDAARRMWVPRPRAPNTIPVTTPTGEIQNIPVRESVVTQNPATSAEEQRMIGTQVPTATDAEAQTDAAMKAAHQTLHDYIDPSGRSAGMTPLQAGNRAAFDIGQMEDQRAAAEAARAGAAQQQTEQLIRDVGGAAPAAAVGGAAPAATAARDVGDTVSGGIRGLFRTARDATNRAYDYFRRQPGSYDPSRLVSVGNELRTALDTAPGADRVRLDPLTTKYGSAALKMIDDEVGRLRFTNEARAPGQPPPRAITPDDMNNILKELVIYRRLANAEARSSGVYTDARAVGRITDEFQNWLERTTTDGGLLTGNADDILSSLQAARAAHAQERETFSRKGTGDVVGKFMENVIGKYPGQEMQPEKIVSTLFGTPDNPFASNAVPILNHLRDRVFGANSPEWGEIKSGMIKHLTETPAGGKPVPFVQQAQRIEKMLSHRQLADAVYDQGQQTRLRQHASDLRRVADIDPVKDTPEHIIGKLTGRIGGVRMTGEQLLATLDKAGGGKVAEALRDALVNSGNADTWARLKLAKLLEVTKEVEGTTKWGHQKIANNIGNFLDTDLADKMLTPNEKLVLKSIGEAHRRIVPVKGTVNYSRSGYENMETARGMTKNLIKMAITGLGLGHGLIGIGAHYSAGHAASEAIDKLATWRQTRRAKDLFLGQRAPFPRQGAYYPGKIGAMTFPQLTRQDDQSSQ